VLAGSIVEGRGIRLRPGSTIFLSRQGVLSVRPLILKRLKRSQKGK